MLPESVLENEEQPLLSQQKSINHASIDNDDVPAKKDSYRNIIILSISFLVLFMGYNSLQNLVTSLLPGDLGNISLAVLYLSVAFFVFVAPVLVSKINEKWSMVIGSACYVIYMGSVIRIVYSVVIIASVIIGFGSAMLWVAFGSYLIKASSKENYGRNSGIFWSLFQLSNVFGNLGAYFIFNHLGDTWLFISFTICGIIGTLGLAVLADPHTLHNHLVAPSRLSLPLSPMKQVKAALVLVFTPPMVMLASMMFFSGYELSFWTGSFPLLLDKHSVGLVLTFAGLGEVVGGVGIGWLSDKLRRGRTIAIMTATIMYGCALAISGLLKHKGVPGFEPLFENASYLSFIAAFCFGVADSTFNTQMYALLGHVYVADESVASFAVFQLYQNIGSALGYFLSLKVTIWVQIWLQVGILSVGMIGYIISDFKWGSHKQQQQEKQQLE